MSWNPPHAKSPIKTAEFYGGKWRLVHWRYGVWKSGATFFQQMWARRAVEKQIRYFIGKVDVFGNYRNFLFPVFFQQRCAMRPGEPLRRYATRVTMATTLISGLSVCWSPGTPTPAPPTAVVLEAPPADATQPGTRKIIRCAFPMTGKSVKMARSSPHSRWHLHSNFQILREKFQRGPRVTCKYHNSWLLPKSNRSISQTNKLWQERIIFVITFLTFSLFYTKYYKTYFSCIFFLIFPKKSQNKHRSS